MDITNESMDPQIHFNSTDFNGRVTVPEHLRILNCHIPCAGLWASRQCINYDAGTESSTERISY